jgi:hypothetical protein
MRPIDSTLYQIYGDFNTYIAFSFIYLNLGMINAGDICLALLNSNPRNWFHKSQLTSMVA